VKIGVARARRNRDIGSSIINQQQKERERERGGRGQSLDRDLDYAGASRIAKILPIPKKGKCAAGAIVNRDEECLNVPETFCESKFLQSYGIQIVRARDR